LKGGFFFFFFGRGVRSLENPRFLDQIDFCCGNDWEIDKTLKNGKEKGKKKKKKFRNRRNKNETSRMIPDLWIRNRFHIHISGFQIHSDIHIHVQVFSTLF
jgi:hypothetical protein